MSCRIKGSHQPHSRMRGREEPSHGAGRSPWADQDVEGDADAALPSQRELNSALEQPAGTRVKGSTGSWDPLLQGYIVPEIWGMGSGSGTKTLVGVGAPHPRMLQWDSREVLGCSRDTLGCTSEALGKAQMLQDVVACSSGAPGI